VYLFKKNKKEGKENCVKMFNGKKVKETQKMQKIETI
jgi:hypothetical protein